MSFCRQFEWDSNKAMTNLKKHNVPFSLAIKVFDDPNAISRLDRIENGEERWQTIGMVDEAHLILVAHTICVWDEDGYVERIRIISARQADRKERGLYEYGSY